MVELHVLLIAHAGLVAGKALVLLENGDERPALQVAQARDDGAGAVLSLVTVNEEGHVACVADRTKNAVHEGLGNVIERLLVALRGEAQHVDPVLFAEFQITLRVVLRAEVQDTAEAQRTEERVVLLGGVAAAVDAGADHREVDGGHQRLARGGGGGGHEVKRCCEISLI